MLTVSASLALGGAGCATRGPVHLYQAGDGSAPVRDLALERGSDDTLTGLLAPDDVVVGLGYEFNTDYIWLRLAPGDRLVTIKRSIREVWYRYDLPSEFASPDQPSLDLAVRAFNRMVYAALPEAGRVGRVTRYGKVLPPVHPGGDARTIGGLAWDQVNDRLLVLYADAEGGEIVAYANETEPVARVRFSAPVAAWTLGYDSNRSRYYVPLQEAGWLGEFDAEGRLLSRLVLPADVRAIDAGQRSAVRVF